jgi:phospholipid/cholesterol/gamma-HCH transport system substrate-binding protein
VFAAAASRNHALTRTVRALPAFLSELRASLSALDGTGAAAEPVIRALEPAAPLLRPALIAVPKLGEALQGAFRDLVPLGPLARRAIPALDSVIKVAGPLGKVIDSAAADANPSAEMISRYSTEAVMDFANLASALQATTTNADGTRQHYLRTLIPITNESLYGQSSRPGTNRHNAYPAPGALEALAHGEPLEALDCRNAGRGGIPSLLGSPPPCVVQQPWTFQGRTATYPQVRREP